MSKNINALMINSILPCSQREGKIKIKKSFVDFYKAIDQNGKIWISNGNSVIGYPITEYEPAETCWLYITADGVSIYPVEKEDTQLGNGFKMNKKDYESIVTNGDKLFKEIFGDFFDITKNISNK